MSKEDIQGLKAQAFDLIVQRQQVEARLAQCTRAIAQLEQEEIGKPATPVTDGSETGENN